MMYQISKRFILSTIALFMISVAQAAPDAGSAAAASEFTMSINDVLVGCAALLLLIIFVLGYTLRSSVLYYHNRRKEESARQSGKGAATVLLLLLLLSSGSAWAQEVADAGAPAVTEFKDSEMLRWILYTVLTLEVLVILQFTRMIRFFTGVEAFSRSQKKSRSRSFTLGRFWEKINRFRPIEEEAGLDTGHSYDGIRELNNVTPPWFIAGFVLTIGFAIVYLWRYHVSETGSAANRRIHYCRC
ncbi:MAG: cbb3-type cytochrome c oxidase N-terminal domain-containing protein [Chitinophagaceae bacterium]